LTRDRQNKTISDQFKSLNNDYAASGVSFILKGVDHTVNKAWATGKNATNILAMKKALRKGDYKTLNVYFRTDLGLSADGNRLLGQCTFPVPSPQLSTALSLDGCMLLHSTVPGGTVPGSNLGKTATHEVGHWFGLFHTFEGESCTGNGDYVSDTPAQATATRGCPTRKDSCPGQPGMDSVSNYMDYSSEYVFSNPISVLG
jgi:hypothetical protein